MEMMLAWTLIKIWLGVFLAIIVSQLVLLLLNTLKTMHFKWIIRFLEIGKWIMIGLALLWVNAVQNSSWYV